MGGDSVTKMKNDMEDGSQLEPGGYMDRQRQFFQQFISHVESEVAECMA